MKEIIGKIEKILEEYCKEYNKIYSDYVKKRSEAKYDELYKLYNELERNLMELEMDYVEKIDEVLKGEYEVNWELIDSNEYFSTLDVSHTRVTYLIATIIEYPKAIKIFADLTETYWKRSGTKELRLDEVYYEEVPIVDERTPFTLKVLKSVPWNLIRDVYKWQIEKMIGELAMAEREGRLEERLKEIEKELEGKLWIYDYQHFYNAIQQAKSS